MGVGALGVGAAVAAEAHGGVCVGAAVGSGSGVPKRFTGSPVTIGFTTSAMITTIPTASTT